MLTADLGTDGYSSLVAGTASATSVSFLVANIAVGAALVVVAALRGLPPRFGTVVQVVVVGATVAVVLEWWETPDDLVARAGLFAAALVVLALGIAVYLASNLGAGPAEAAALAWDPPLPFRWSYTVLQGSGALVGWLLGATIGVGTLAVVVLIGPMVDLAARLLRVDIHQHPAAS